MTALEYDINPETLARIEEHYGDVRGRSTIGTVELSDHYDIEFPNMYQAMLFARYISTHIELAEPAHSLHEIITLRAHLPQATASDQPA